MGWVTIKGNHVLIGDASQAETARHAEAGPPHHHVHAAGKEPSQLKVDPEGPLGRALLKARPMEHYYGKIKFER